MKQLKVAEPSKKKSVDSSKNLIFSVECRESRKCNAVVGGGDIVAELSKTKSVDSSINNCFVRRLKQVIQIRKNGFFRILGIPAFPLDAYDRSGIQK